MRPVWAFAEESHTETNKKVISIYEIVVEF